MTRITRILVATDFSGCSRDALQHALDLAHDYGAIVDVLHVWELPQFGAADLALYMPGTTSQTLAEYIESAARRELDEVIADLYVTPPVEVRGLVRSGQAEDEILAQAEVEAYDLIVVGTHGRTGLQHVLLGSVAEKVVRRAQVPVLTVGVAKKKPAAERRPSAALR